MLILPHVAELAWSVDQPALALLLLIFWRRGIRELIHDFAGQS
jgi:hypothetical protein